MDVAIYARLSKEDQRDRDGRSSTPKGAPSSSARPGESTATQRQIADARARADLEGWNIVGIYEDPDHSASDPRKKRPDFERLLRDLDDGLAVDRVLCYKMDRLLRQPKEAERIIDLADRRGFGIVSLNDPNIDLETPTGRAMFRMTITWARLETDTMSLRIRRKAKDIAEAGRPAGGGIRPFGLRVVRGPDGKPIPPFRYEPDPKEARLIREAADRIIGGSSVHSIVKDWNERGIRTPGRAVAPEGRKWEASSLKRMITAPRIVGDREHRGVVVGTGGIPPMLDRETFDQLCAILASRTGPAQGPKVRKHFLTGVLFCGRCGAKLVARPDAKGTTRYVCAVPRGCGGITVKKDNIEPLIAESILVYLESPAFREAVAQAGGNASTRSDLALLEADEAALNELSTTYFVDRAITKPEYNTARAALDARVATTRRRIASTSSSSALATLASVGDFRAEWERRDPREKNELAALVIEKITVNPAPRRGTRFDPERLDVLWIETRVH